ncbi:M20 metallopeptidase family protein [Alicyclobacillus ferrooxydans]|uniref:N-acyl-L-amino acid amidohydrolase n=1 Tax=Alicyclobacillus ferrooxydans TaxID=471514 RepID=A0A0P9D4V9_9BACL|nr:amidohydrolase [Alicyclobacillus ferrooxydans]KPV44473.1 N-acyl-L-amino acid amidohydrolase [Alicyclobacillus ferrooxydans]
MTPQSISELVAGVKDDVIGWRRHLHQNPELSFQEENTSQYVYNILESFGGLELSRPTKTSVVARLIGKQPGKVLAIRADMDALPILEDTSFEFKSSNPGVMHACGHDGHTAMLLGTAKILTGLKEHLVGEVRFLFQHAEELFPGGASQMVAAGVMEGVGQVIGIHLKSMMEPGIVSVQTGPVNAAPDTFHVRIIGSGGHAAYPHTTVDSVLIAAQAITNLQHIVSRNKDPLDRLVLSVTRIMGGTADNVIPGCVEFGGTVRSYNPALRDNVPEWMERIIKGVTAAHGATYEFEYTRGYDPVVNDDEVTKIVEETLKGVFGEERVVNGPPTMGGEDFSAFQKAAPGTFFQVGAGYGPKESWHPHHHPKFAINEDALPVGVEAFVNLAFRLLQD